MVFICIHCSKKFKNELCYNKHINKRSCIQNNICKYCNKKFYNIYNLQRHLDNKGCKILKLQCIKCNTIFNSEYLLNEHNKTNPNCTTSIICEYCGKLYSNRSNLQRHQKTICGPTAHIIINNNTNNTNNNNNTTNNNTTIINNNYYINAKQCYSDNVDFNNIDNIEIESDLKKQINNGFQKALDEQLDFEHQLNGIDIHRSLENQPNLFIFRYLIPKIISAVCTNSKFSNNWIFKYNYINDTIQAKDDNGIFVNANQIIFKLLYIIFTQLNDTSNIAESLKNLYQSYSDTYNNINNDLHLTNYKLQIPYFLKCFKNIELNAIIELERIIQLRIDAEIKHLTPPSNHDLFDNHSLPLTNINNCGGKSIEI